MSPEQIQGQPLDHRSDVFSFGLVLYELLSGRRAFADREPQAIMNAILTRDPPSLSESRGVVTPAVDRILRRCLEKRPSERFQSAHDLAFALQAVADMASVQGVWRPPGFWRRRYVRGAAVVGALALALGLATWWWREHATIDDLEAVPLTSTLGSEFHPALSADGDRVAFVWNGKDGSNFDIYVKQIGTNALLRLTSDPAFDCCPAFSPKEDWIAFIRVSGGRGAVLMVPALGGPERRLGEVETWLASSLSWSPDGEWLAYSDRPAPGKPPAVFMMSKNTLERRQLTEPGPEQVGDGFATFSPDGSEIAFVRFPGMGSQALTFSQLGIVPVGGGPPRIIHQEPQGIEGLAWTPNGRDLLFSGLGKAAPHLYRISAARHNVRPLSGGPSDPHLGGIAEVVGEVSRMLRLSVSANGKLAFSQSRYDTDIWRLDLRAPAGDGARRELIASTQVDESPQYSPDGTRIAFASSRESPRSEIWTCASDGTDCYQLTSMSTPAGTPRWSPDGTRLAFDANVDGQTDVYVVDVASRVTHALTRSPREEAVPSWSRDGRWIYFTSDRAGVWQIFRMPAAGGEVEAVTADGGFAAIESVDGTELYYTKDSQRGLWKRSLAGGPEVKINETLRCWGYWTPAREGIYFIDTETHSMPEIRLLHPQNGAVETVAALSSEPACAESDLAVSPDGRTLLYVKAIRESDLMLADLGVRRSTSR
jgi:Tol biopolymer transport system component